MPQPTVHRLTYRGRVSALNRLAAAAEALGLPLGELEAASILEAARRRTGLEDWGDEHFIEPLRLLIELARSADFTPLARVVFRQTWVQGVSNRLLSQAWLKAHPQLLDHKVRRPIFVLGFPRTGTTLLQNLLAQHSSRRALQFWELSTPVPVCEDPTRDKQRRLRTASWLLRGAYQIAPEMGEVHFIAPDTYEECWPLFANSFSVMNYDLQSGMSPYGDWLTTRCDMHRPYQEYSQQLSLMLSREPADQLVLKCPEHLWFLDALLDTFPDACVVWTHRDPHDTLASYCSLMSMQWRTLYGKIDGPKIGAHMSERLRQGVERAMLARRGRDPARFFDVHFHELVADPLGVTQRIHEHFDLEGAEEVVPQGQAYLAKKRQDARGKHRYSAELYGLRREEVTEHFHSYIQHFDVQLPEVQP